MASPKNKRNKREGSSDEENSTGAEDAQGESWFAFNQKPDSMLLYTDKYESDSVEILTEDEAITVGKSASFP